jgi:hypothetical protein
LDSNFRWVLDVKKVLTKISQSALCCASFFSLAAALTQSIYAADTSCKVVAKAGDAALASTCIHQATYMPVKGANGPVTADLLGHHIVIDKTMYSSVLKGLFDAKPITTASERSQGVYYVHMLADMDSDCRALGKVTLAGRSAMVFENGSNKKSDDVHFKMWIDSATGLPLRADLNEAEVGGTDKKSNHTSRSTVPFSPLNLTTFASKNGASNGNFILKTNHISAAHSSGEHVSRAPQRLIFSGRFF